MGGVFQICVIANETGGQGGWATSDEDPSSARLVSQLLSASAHSVGFRHHTALIGMWTAFLCGRGCTAPALMRTCGIDAWACIHKQCVLPKQDNVSPLPLRWIFYFLMDGNWLSYYFAILHASSLTRCSEQGTSDSFLERRLGASCVGPICLLGPCDKTMNTPK
ncbi:hypothetical protein CALVIDRAFT_435339 [Calocera viscosa TUFC12733]|uniref:Uncharacterized protein n=1 Tax=Calocera viscosa (strain TUFC12733) TaxID=1330018 RepID=A0A167FWX9_CALVF|nr:hypothetical protein CALVIDRAFT_435339 [Calocera viscosa TUFC12733]